MPDQLSLLGFEQEEPASSARQDRAAPRKPPRFNIFFAILPDDETAQTVSDNCKEFAEKFGLIGRPRKPGVLHVSLHGVIGCDFMPHDLIDCAGNVAASLSASTFDIEFDRIKTFGGRGDTKPLVLCDQGGNAPLKDFRQKFGIALANADLPVDPHFTPHMTFMYGQEFSGAHPVAPIRWRATEFALILSHYGQERYERLGSWILRNDDA